MAIANSVDYLDLDLPIKYCSVTKTPTTNPQQTQQGTASKGPTSRFGAQLPTFMRMRHVSLSVDQDLHVQCAHSSGVCNTKLRRCLEFLESFFWFAKPLRKCLMARCPEPKTATVLWAKEQQADLEARHTGLQEIPGWSFGH